MMLANVQEQRADAATAAQKDDAVCDANAFVYLDLTHLGRHVTGIERVSIDQFEAVTFKGATVRHVRARGILSMILKQQLLLPLIALFNPRALFVFPGFPPSPFFRFLRARTLFYVHDLFLMTRKQDLGLKARLYMAWPFEVAVRGLTYFLVNSEKTRAELAPFVRSDAQIRLYRPSVRNVFDAAPDGRAERPSEPRPLRLVAIGTVEPRKNYAAAVAIAERLAALLPHGAELSIVGRDGWGAARAELEGTAHVKLCGYVSTEEARRLIGAADVYLCTSHDEGLGLPLLEVQYSGLLVAAPDQPVFREVLGQSGLFIDPSDPERAARAIRDVVTKADWRAKSVAVSIENVTRWNRLAEGDRRFAKGLFVGPLEAAMRDAGARSAA